MNNPNIIGGSRVALSAAIVCACILAYVAFMILLTSFSLRPASVDLLAQAPGFC